MPFKSQQKKKEKKGGFGSWLKQQASDVGGAVSGVPGGLYEGSLAGMTLINMGLNPGVVKKKDKDRLKKVLGAQVDSVKALGSTKDWREHTAMNTLTLLGVLAPPAKGLSVVRGAPKNPTRLRTYKVRNQKEAEFYSRELGYKVRPGAVLKASTPLSRQPITRGVQKMSDAGRRQVPALQKRALEKDMMKRKAILDRLDEPNAEGLMDALSNVKRSGVRKNVSQTVRHPIKEGNALIRALRLYRGAYVPPNWGGAQVTNLIQQGPYRYQRNVRAQRKMAKGEKTKHLGFIPGHSRSPEAMTFGRVTGDTAAEAARDIGQAGTISTITRGVGTSLGKVTDRAARNRALLDELARHDVDIFDQGALKQIAEAATPEAREVLIQSALRAEPAAIKFTRTPTFPGRRQGPISALDKALQNQLFLYRWLTGSTRYGGHMLAEHPTLSSVLLNAGEEAPRLQDMFGEENIPEFMKSYVSRGGNRINNPQAASLWDMPFSILDSLGETSRNTREISDILNPMQASLVNALTQYDPFRNQQVNYPMQPEDALRFGFGTQVRSIPWLEWGRLRDDPETRERRLFPLSPLDIALRQTLGSSLHPTGFPFNPEIARRMAEQERERRVTGTDESTLMRLLQLLGIGGTSGPSYDSW